MQISEWAALIGLLMLIQTIFRSFQFITGFLTDIPIQNLLIKGINFLVCRIRTQAAAKTINIRNITEMFFSH